MIMLMDQNIQHTKNMLLSKFEEYFQKKYLIPFHVAMEEQSNHENSDAPSNKDDVDPDALAYIRAKKKVDIIHKVKKQDKLMQKA